MLNCLQFAPEYIMIYFSLQLIYEVYKVQLTLVDMSVDFFPKIHSLSLFRSTWPSLAQQQSVSVLRAESDTIWTILPIYFSLWVTVNRQQIVHTRSLRIVSAWYFIFLCSLYFLFSIKHFEFLVIESAEMTV
jgi:hypothetical protein